MPFVRKTDSQGSQPPTDTRKLFIGRTGELLFFVQNILKSEEPTHNIISIWGQGGVGKSTLLAGFINEAHSADFFKEYCLTALVDERQTTPTSIMEKFADQLHMKGDFEKALKQYKEALRKLQLERETMQDAVLNRVPDLAGAAAEMVPLVGPLLREGAKATTGLFLDNRQKVHMNRDTELLEDPLDDLTRAFVEELNQLTDTQVSLSSGKVKNRRVILFFDTFEQLATEAVPWLLDYFLLADINSNIVLIIAGRYPLERSIPDDTKRWLPYIDNEIIYWIPLNSFTEDETRAYLMKRDITDPDRIATVWQLSKGLPLYLSLLTSNPRGKVDPTANVVANFLRWIPKQEQIKRQLALDASLFSRPFNLDDLAAFTYIPENELPSLYYWLIGQPFVRPQDGRYSYHDLARELFGRHLYQRSKKGYNATRRALATHYQQSLEEIQMEEDKEVHPSGEWLLLVLALVYQLLLLPDEASHIKAIERVLNIHHQTSSEEKGEVVRILRELSQEQPNNLASPATRQIAKNLLQYIETDLKSQEFLVAATYLLEKVGHEPSFSVEFLAHLYRRRGIAYSFFNEHQRAIEDFQHVVELDHTAYNERGLAYIQLKKYQQAIAEFDHALELVPSSAVVYNNRGWAYYALNEYQQAITDYDHALELNPNYNAAYVNRGLVYMEIKEYRKAIADTDHALALKSDLDIAYALKGAVYRELKDFQQAMIALDHALMLTPKLAWAYAQRAFTYLWLKDTRHAFEDFTHHWELNSSYIDSGWMVEWLSMCKEKADLETAGRLEKIASTEPEQYVAYVCQGVAFLLRKLYEEALAELEHAIQLEPDRWSAYFWEGMTFASLGRNEEATATIEKALKEGLPPILLTPLRWFEQDKPDFYQKYVVPLMARYDLV